MNEMLQISCDELRAMAESYPDEIEIIVEMMIEAEADLCQDAT
ncbi:MAG: hypothetical protein ABW105_15990 [Candidatus Thiodiazotropha sp. 6PLUC1]